MYSILYSKMFIDDLDEALIYIKEILKNIDASTNLKLNVHSKIQNLKQFPHIGTKLYKDNIETKYRYIKVDNYYVFYYIKEQKVFIDRFIYSKRDFIMLLNI